MSEKTKLWKDESIESGLILPDMEPYAPLAPAMLVVPGGGYGTVCHSTEGVPIAARFTQLGFRCFTLDYRVTPHTFPAPLQDAMRAVRFIRANAERFHIRPGMLAAVGFSAGGHLVASLGTISQDIDADDGDDLDGFSAVPDAVILSYPVITGGGFAHQNSVKRWSGKEAPTDDDIALFSLENHVSAATPPAFVWSTIEDELVPCENTLLFFDAMRKAGRPCDMHIFPHGRHGMQMGYGRRDIALWPEMARNFLTDTCGFAF